MSRLEHYARAGLLPAVLALLSLTASGMPPDRAALAQGSSQASGQVSVEKVKAALPELEKLANDTLRKTGVPGLAIAVVYQDQTLYLKGFGVRQAGTNERIDADTVFQLASMSKPIASTVVAALVSGGVVTWDDRVIEHDPGFRMYDGWVTREVTIRDFFAHRSGLPGTAGDDLEQVGYERSEILRRLRYVRPASSLRSLYAYSNFGLTEGAVAAARAAGRPWEDVAADRLYKPLGMASTSSRFKDYVAAKNRALLHVLVNGKWVAKFTRNPDAQSPAGGVSSTARDLARWVRLELARGMFEGKQLIKADALEHTHRPVILKGANLVTGSPAFYGLGWNVDSDDRGRVFWNHAGAFSLGARTYVSLLPSEGLGIVVLANAFPTGVPDGIAAGFYDLVLNGRLSRDWIAFWNKPYDSLVQAWTTAAAVYTKPPAQASPALPLVAYVGTYGNDYFGNIEIIDRDGVITLLIGPRKKSFPLKHRTRDVFLYEPDAELPGILSGVTFTIGPDLKAQQVVLENYNDNDQGRFVRVPAAK